MAGPTPKTDKWTARENKQGKKGGYLLLVNGLVQVDDTTKQAALTPSPVRNPKILNLNLSIETGEDAGDQASVWTPATHSETIRRDQYAKVDIRWDGSVIASCEVLNDREYELHLVEITEEADEEVAASVQKKLAPAQPGAGKQGAGRQGASKQGSAKKGSAKKGSAKQGTAKKGAAKKGSAQKSSARAGATRRPARNSSAGKRPASR